MSTPCRIKHIRHCFRRWLCSGHRHPGGRQHGPRGFRVALQRKRLDRLENTGGRRRALEGVDGVIDYDAGSEASGDKALWSEVEYRDFILQIDWRLKEAPFINKNIPYILPDGTHAKDIDGKELKLALPDADSGVYLRGDGRFQANIWCWPIGSGEMYSVRMDPKSSPELRPPPRPAPRPTSRSASGTTSRSPSKARPSASLERQDRHRRGRPFPTCPTPVASPSSTMAARTKTANGPAPQPGPVQKHLHQRAEWERFREARRAVKGSADHRRPRPRGCVLHDLRRIQGPASLPVVTSATAFKTDLRGKYDVLIMYDFTRDLDEAGKKNLRDFVESGGGRRRPPSRPAELPELGLVDRPGRRRQLSPQSRRRSPLVKRQEQSADLRHSGGEAPDHRRESLRFTSRTKRTRGMRISPRVRPLLTTDHPQATRIWRGSAPMSDIGSSQSSSATAPRPSAILPIEPSSTTPSSGRPARPSKFVHSSLTPSGTKRGIIT